MVRLAWVWEGRGGYGKIMVGWWCLSVVGNSR